MEPWKNHNAYATGSVTGSSNVGGIIRQNYGSVAGLYWLNSAGATISGIGTGLGTYTTVSIDPNLQGGEKYAYDPLTWAGFDLDSVGGQNKVWRIYDCYTMPLLKAFLTQATLNFEDQSVEYDGQSHAPIGIALSGGLSMDKMVVGGGKINAGTYSGLDFAYSDQQGYDLVQGNGAFTITQRNITINAENAPPLYGDANPTLTYVIGGGGLVAGDTLTGSLATAAVLTSDVGNYGITQGDLAASANYLLSFEGGTLAVTPRALIITANNFSRFYGMANPVLTYTLSGDGLVLGDTLTGEVATHANLLSAAGNYGILQNSLSASANYRISYGPGVLTILPRQTNSNEIASTIERHNAKSFYPDWIQTDDGSGSAHALDALGGN